MVTMSSSSFEEAVQFALERLHMEDLYPKEEQLQSIKAVYDGQKVFVCLYIYVYKQDFEKRSFLS